MIGHLTPKTCGISAQNKDNYRVLYCSMCASLRKQGHLGYSFLINRELLLILSALQEDFDDQEIYKTPCPAKAYTGTQPVLKGLPIDKAANVAILLVWLKIVDWASDEAHWYHHLLKFSFQKKAKKTLDTLSESFQHTFKTYLKVTKENEQDFEKVNELSAQFSRSIVGELIPTKVAKNLHLYEELFGLCGRLIHLGDHLIDAEKDLFAEQYNPIIQIAREQNLSLMEAYQVLLRQYNLYRVKSREVLQKIQKAGKADFVQLMHNVFKQLDKKIDKYRPSFAQEENLSNKETTSKEFVLVQNDCDCGGCDCGGGDCCCSNSDCWGSCGSCLEGVSGCCDWNCSCSCDRDSCCCESKRKQNKKRRTAIDYDESFGSE